MISALTETTTHSVKCNFSAFPSRQARPVPLVRMVYLHFARKLLSLCIYTKIHLRQGSAVSSFRSQTHITIAVVQPFCKIPLHLTTQQFAFNCFCLPSFHLYIAQLAQIPYTVYEYLQWTTLPTEYCLYSGGNTDQMFKCNTYFCIHQTMPDYFMLQILKLTFYMTIY